ncbi:MAG: endolytic transglycosylase MltG [Anaerovoracaceae bacterium]|jgi:UPF0755 protein|nr:endolytic transglycosylase MltG [Anaerovoracaceae bacterium]
MARNNRRAKGKRSSLPLLGFVVIIILLVVVGGLLYIDGLNKPFDSENKEYISISIPMGTATQSIGKILEEEGIIKDSQRFKWYAKIHGYNGELEAGDYLLSPSMTMEEIMNMMTEGFSQASRFVIQEGLTIKQVAESLEKSGMTTVDDFLYEVEYGEFDYIFVDFLPSGPSRLEGFLMPNTYDVPMGSDAHFIINTMLAQFNKIYKDEYYSRATELGYDLNQIITIASMIERETRVEKERTIVSSVIYNRLNIGMPLQIDATVQYALGEWKERLLFKDLKIDSPYNTYIVPGLPIGPICSPGENSIIAALYPDTTDYLYYVLDPSLNGSHRFSQDYDTFLINRDEYLKAME